MSSDEQTIKLKKPTFGKVKSLHPEKKNVNLMLKCIGSKQVEGNKSIWEVQCGDDTGMVTLSVQNKEQVDLCTEGASLRVQNAKVIIVKGFIRIAIDKWAVLKTADEPVDFEVNKETDMSATEYELAEE